MKLQYHLVFKDSGHFDYQDYESEPSEKEITNTANEFAQANVKKYNEWNRHSFFFQPRFLNDIRKIKVREWDTEKKSLKRKGFKLDLKKVKLTIGYKDGSREVRVSFMPVLKD